MNNEVFDFFAGITVGFFVWFFGQPGGTLTLLITLSVIDYLSGTLIAWYGHELSSRTGFKGIFKKCIMLTFVGIAHLLDVHLLGGNETIKTVVCLFYISTEGISIIENADKLNIPIPSVLRERFLQLKERNQSGEEKAEKQKKK